MTIFLSRVVLTWLLARVDGDPCVYRGSKGVEFLDIPYLCANEWPRRFKVANKPYNWCIAFCGTLWPYGLKVCLLAICAIVAVGRKLLLSVALAK